MSTNVEWQPRPDLNLSAGTRSVWGRSWGYRRAYYDLSLAELPVRDPGADRLPALHELDLGGSYALRVGTLDLAVQLTVLNALDRRNVFDQWLDPVDASGRVKFVQSRTTQVVGRQLLLTIRARSDRNDWS